MDLKQRYTQEIPQKNYEFDQTFLEQLQDLPRPDGFIIAMLLDNNAKHLPILNGWTQKVGGVLHNKGQMFYEVEFLKQQDEYPVFLGMNPIEADDYLDYINNKQILKSHEEIQLDEFFYKNFNSDNPRSL